MNPYSPPDVVPRLTYKPGWTFDTWEDGRGGWRIRATAPTPSSDSGEPGEYVGECVYTPGATGSTVAAYVERMLEAGDRHERHEWLKLDGERVHPPRH